MRRIKLTKLLLITALASGVLNLFSEIPESNTLRMVSSSKYVASRGEHLLKSDLSKNRNFIATTTNNTLQFKDFTDRLEIPHNVVNFSRFGSVSCFEDKDICVVCGIGGCLTIDMSKAEPQFLNKYHHNKYTVNMWGKTYYDFVHDVIALRTTNHFFAAESMREGGAGLVRYSTEGLSCYQNVNAKLLDEQIEWDEYHLAYGRYTSNVAMTSVGSGHLWIMKGNSLTDITKTYQFSPGTGLGYKVGPVKIFSDNAGGPNRLVTCNRFDPRVGCITFNYQNGQIRNVFNFQHGVLKTKHVLLQNFVESAFFVVIWDNILYVAQDRFEKVETTAFTKNIRNTLEIQQIFSTTASPPTILRERLGGIRAHADLTDHMMITDIRDGWNYEKLMLVTPHEIIDNQFSFDVIRSADALSDLGTSKTHSKTRHICAVGCGSDETGDPRTYEKKADGSADTDKPQGKVLGAGQTEDLPLLVSTAFGDTPNTYKCFFAYRPQDCRKETALITLGARTYGVCKNENYWIDTNNAYELDSGTGALVICKQKTPGLTTSLNNRVAKPSDLSYSTTDQVCTNATLASTATTSSSGMSDTAKGLLIALGILIGLILLVSIICCMAKKEKKHSYQPPMGGFMHNPPVYQAGPQMSNPGLQYNTPVMKQYDNSSMSLNNASAFTNQMGPEGQMMSGHTPPPVMGSPMHTPMSPGRSPRGQFGIGMSPRGDAFGPGMSPRGPAPGFTPRGPGAGVPMGPENYLSLEKQSI